MREKLYHTYPRTSFLTHVIKAMKLECELCETRDMTIEVSRFNYIDVINYVGVPV